MFSGAGAESLCCKPGVGSGYATEGGAGANLATVAQPQPQSARTITARDVPFPLDDPYSPVNNAGVPVPGYNVWPRQANRLGRRYYGLEPAASSIASGATPKAAQALTKAFAKPAGFAGLGGFFDGSGYTTNPVSGNVDWLGEIGEPPILSPTSTAQGGGINWDTFFGGLFKTLPGTISAITGRGDPLNRQGVQLPATTYDNVPTGYRRTSSGELVQDAVGSVTNFVTENPLLVGGAILGVILLFMKSPSGRR